MKKNLCRNAGNAGHIAMLTSMLLAIVPGSATAEPPPPAVSQDWMLEQHADALPESSYLPAARIEKGDHAVLLVEGSKSARVARIEALNAELDEECGDEEFTPRCMREVECRELYMLAARRSGDTWKPGPATRLGGRWCGLNANGDFSINDLDGDGRDELMVELIHTENNYAQAELTWRYIVDLETGKTQFVRMIKTHSDFEPMDWQTVFRSEFVDVNGDDHPDLKIEQLQYSDCKVDDAGWPTEEDAGDGPDGCRIEGHEKAELLYQASEDVWAEEGE